MKSKIIKKCLIKQLSHMKYYNNLAPFNIYDSEYVNDIENKLKEIMNDKLKEYDNEPVVACKYCKSLHVLTDELDNNICMKCGSVNELQNFDNIFEYQKFLKDKNEQC